MLVYSLPIFQKGALRALESLAYCTFEQNGVYIPARLVKGALPELFLINHTSKDIEAFYLIREPESPED